MAEVLEAVTVFPSGDDRRWEELERLEECDQREVVAEAVRLLESGATDDMVLGAEMLDVYVMARALDAYVLAQEIDDSERDLIVRVLRDAASPARAPAVIAAALGPYAVVDPHFPELLSPAIAHPDPLVRRTAARLVATIEDLGEPVSASEPRIPQEVLRDFLQQDPDPEVRGQAAEGLRSIYEFLVAESGVPDALKVYEYLRSYTADPLPKVRAEALSVAIAENEPGWPSLLAHEFLDPQVDSRFMTIILRLRAPLGAEEVATLMHAVNRLQGRDRPAATPLHYLEEPTREELLALVIEHLTILQNWRPRQRRPGLLRSLRRNWFA